MMIDLIVRYPRSSIYVVLVLLGAVWICRMT